MKLRKPIALFLALLLLLASAVSTADVLNIDLSTATDEELAAAAAQIKAEQQARLKVSVRLDPAETTVSQGASQKVSASVADLPEGVTAGAFTWSSSDEAVATCSNGTIKGVGPGTASITCSTILSDGSEVFSQVSVTVVVPVKTLAFTSKKIEIMVGDTIVPELTFVPDNASDKTVTLVSSDDKVVSIDENGQLVAVQAGKAIITATPNDGSKGSAKLEVKVNRKIGKYDEELTFQGLVWGSDAKEVAAKLAETGFIEDADSCYLYTTNYMHYWPDNDLKFASWNDWQELPVAFRDQSTGSAELNISPQKKVGGYSPYQVELYFLNSIENGEINKEKTELYGIYIYFDNKHEPGSSIFVDLLSKMEAQYGEFTRYVAKDLTRYYRDVYAEIKNSMEGATEFRYKELGKDTWLSDVAICTLRGKNNTGIMLMMDSSQNVTLFYCRTDVLDRIKAVQDILEAVPDEKEDAGI